MSFLGYTVRSSGCDSWGETPEANSPALLAVYIAVEIEHVLSAQSGLLAMSLNTTPRATSPIVATPA